MTNDNVLSHEPVKLYIAGPMRGIKDFNFPAFDEAAQLLRSAGYNVCNPADRDRDLYGADVCKSETGSFVDIIHTGFSLSEALAWDMAWIAEHAEGIAVLPGWENSKGARAEVALAEALGIDVGTIAYWMGADDESPKPTTGEIRVKADTGGEKGSKPARYDLIPTVPLDFLARLYGRGAEKYADHNWALGYDWSLSFAAMQRHSWAFWGGEDMDKEMGVPHMTCAAFHAFALVHFLNDPKYKRFDNRWKPDSDDTESDT